MLVLHARMTPVKTCAGVSIITLHTAVVLVSFYINQWSVQPTFAPCTLTIICRKCQFPFQDCPTQKVYGPTACWTWNNRGRIHQTWNWVTFCDPATQWPGNPATRRPSWPCSIMNSNCRLILQTNVCNEQEFASFYRCLAFARFWKVKFWRSFIKCQYFNDGWTDFHKKYISLSWAFFRKPEKLGSHTGSEWWPGDPDVKDDPNDPVPCLVYITLNPRSFAEPWWVTLDSVRENVCNYSKNAKSHHFGF